LPPTWNGHEKKSNDIFFFYELKLYNQTPKQYISTPVKTGTLPKGNTDSTTEYSGKIKASNTSKLQQANYCTSSKTQLQAYKQAATSSIQKNLEARYNK
jgi:hypothetical protein